MEELVGKPAGLAGEPSEDEAPDPGSGGEPSGPVVWAAAPLGWADGVAGIGLLLAVAWTYAPLLTFEQSLFAFDISTLNLPARSWAFEQIASGHFPFWCPHYNTGFPFLADSQAGVLYWPNWLLYGTLPGWKACSLAYVLHVLWCGLGMYALIRPRASAEASLIAALSVALAGRMLVHQPHPGLAETIAWFPWGLVAIDRLVATADRRWLGVLGLVVAHQWVAGSIAMAVICWMGYGTWSLLQAVSLERGRTRLLAWLVLPLMVGTLAAAFQILPTFELWGYSHRAGGLDPTMRQWGSLPPWLWSLAWLPSLFGRLGDATAWMDGEYPWLEMGLYQGVLLLPLAAAGLASRHVRSVWLFAGLAAAGVIAASGKFHLAGELPGVVLGMGSLRVAVRYWLLASIGLAGLAALGVDRLREPRPGDPRGLAILVILLGALGTAWVGWNSIAEVRNTTSTDPDFPITQAIRLSEFWQVHIARVRIDFFATGKILATGVVLLFLIHRFPFGAWGLVALVAWDVGSYARSVYPVIEPSFHNEPQSVAWIQENANPPRVLVIDPKPIVMQPGYWKSLEPYRQPNDALYYERGPLFGIGLVSTHATLSLELERWQRIRTTLPPLRLADVTGCGLLMANRPLDGDGLEQPPAYRRHACWIYRRANALPYAYWIAEGEFDPALADPPTAAKRLGETEPIPLDETPEEVLLDEDARPVRFVWDPRKRVLLAAEPDSLAAGARSPNQEPAGEALAIQPAEATWHGPNRQVISMEVPAAGFLVRNETWYSGWSAWLDGEPVEILLANGLVQAVPVPAGSHTLEFRFTPRRVWLAGALSLAGCIGLAWLTLRRGRLRPFVPRVVTRSWVASLIAFVLASFAISFLIDARAWLDALPNLLARFR